MKNVNAPMIVLITENVSKTEDVNATLDSLGMTALTRDALATVVLPMDLVTSQLENVFVKRDTKEYCVKERNARMIALDMVNVLSVENVFATLIL